MGAAFKGVMTAAAAAFCINRRRVVVRKGDFMAWTGNSINVSNHLNINQIINGLRPSDGKP